MQIGHRHDVVVLIATKGRRELLLHRALPSVLRQTLSPARIVIVDDADGEADTGELERDAAALAAPIEVLRNRRTRGASGAWSSGLDHIARPCGAPAGVFVAILDDDDEWEPRHLELCYRRATDADANVVATGFVRIEEGGTPPRPTAPPTQIDFDEVLVRNPGIQGSNLFFRLDILLEAGCFDEALASCTDRDLCLRLVALPNLRYTVVEEVTARHYACSSRPRLSTHGSVARLAGLDTFWLKYAPLMTAQQRRAFEERATRLFDWRPAASPHCATPVGQSGPLPDQDARDGGVALLVAFIADVERVENVAALLDDLMLLRTEHGLTGLDVVILENGPSAAASSDLAGVVADRRDRGLRVHFVSRPRHATDALEGLVGDGGVSRGRRLSIGAARTALQSYAYAIAKTKPGVVVWVLDDDMRLDSLVDDGDKRERRRLAIVPQVLRLRDTGADIAIGAYTGAPPLPFAATVRVQLVDVLGSLQWFKRLPPDERLPDMRARNRALQAGRRDFYYDLSRRETDRLETPFLFEADRPCTVGEAFELLCARVDRILAGEQVSRPLAVPVRWSSEDLTGQLKRGGNTFIFDVEALRDVPNIAPDIDGRTTRRSDMIWALVQRGELKRRVVTAPVGVFHDRSRVVPSVLDVDRVIDDIRGFAVYSALEDCLTTDNDRLLAERVSKYVEERLAAFRLSFHRCRGAARAVRALLNDGWMTEGRFDGARQRLISFLERLDHCYTPDALVEIEEGARLLRPVTLSTFRSDLSLAMSEHRERASRAAAALAKEDVEQRVLNARCVVERLVAPSLPLRVLGAGAEGVALTDGARVYKVFDYWKARDAAAQRAGLRSLVGRFRGRRHLYPIEAFPEDGLDAVLVYAFEESEPYVGGLGPSLVELLVECHAEKIVCHNLHPDNLRVVEGRVRLIDYGSDIHPFEDEGDFEQMCRRAFLSWRYSHRADLKEIMRRALVDRSIPHLDGFERFLDAVRLRAGARVRPEPLRARAVQLHAAAVLDYGCGRGALLRVLAPVCDRIVGFDPDVALWDKWRDLVDGGAIMTNAPERAVSEGPFDLIVCERVICTLEDDAEVANVLRDLRGAVKPDGRVLISVCHPAYAWKGPTPESIPHVPPEAHPDSQFTWEKTMLGSGRRRREVHRSERRLTGLLARQGLRVVGRDEARTVDTERFEYSADTLILELAPSPPPRDVTLMLKACAMDAETLEAQALHIVAQLDGGSFAERLLVLDSQTGSFLREHRRGDMGRLRTVAERLLALRLIDRVVDGPVHREAERVNGRWFGVASAATHATNGAQVASTLAGFDACETRYVLQVDIDAMIRRDPGHDYLAEMLAALQSDERAVTVAFNIAQDHDRPYTREGAAGPWRTEVRCCLLDLERLRELLPLENEAVSGHLRLPWHRALDRAVQSGRVASLRGGARSTFYVHPQNARKTRDADAWCLAMAQLERCVVPPAQLGEVEWVGGLADWAPPERHEPFVVVIVGRNVPPGRFRRCVESLSRQTREDWGAIVIDDASELAVASEMRRIAEANLGARATYLAFRTRRGGMANLELAVRHLCGNPESVIVTLDADDALLGPRVLDRVAREYRSGADMTIGSMLRTDKAVRYPVSLDDPRSKRGGNVWQHLRTFKKRLFDAVPPEDFRVEGALADLAYDWAFMLPMVEIAVRPVVIEEELYLYEPSGEGKGDGRARRERAIAAIVAKPTRRGVR